MRHLARGLKGWVAVLVVVVVAACAKEPPPAPTPVTGPVTDGGATLYVAELGLKPRERYRKALDLLGSGEFEYARVELKTLIDERPGYGQASDLIAQLDADPVATLGRESFTITVHPGDTISTLAHQYLGDPLRFVALARYNDLVVPNQLPAGTRLQIPGRQRAVSPPPDPVPEPSVLSKQTQTAKEASEAPPVVWPAEPEPTSGPSPAQILAEARQDAQQKRRAGNLDGAIAILTENGPRPRLDAQTNALLASLYLDRGRQAFSTGDWDQAERDFRAGQRADPGNVRIQEQLFELETIRTANTLYDEGLRHLQRDELGQAHAKLSKAVGLYPDLPGARQALEGVEPPLIESYYRQAQRQFRQQELDQALVSLDKILAINSDNREARGLRMKVVELQERIGALSEPGN